MSEQPGTRTEKVVALLLWSVVIFAFSADWGERRMKRWQDEWYAGHPVVNDVYHVFTAEQACVLVNGEWRDVRQQGLGGYPHCVLPSAPAPKPSKGRKPAEIGSPLYINRGEQEPAPKPPDDNHSWVMMDNGAYCVVISATEPLRPNWESGDCGIPPKEWKGWEKMKAEALKKACQHYPDMEWCAAAPTEDQ